MTAMRHWIAHWDHGKIAVQAHVVLTAESADEHRANGWRVEGPFVLDTTRGAVDRAARLEHAIVAMDEAVCHNNVSEAKRIARAAVLESFSNDPEAINPPSRGQS